MDGGVFGLILGLIIFVLYKHRYKSAFKEEVVKKSLALARGKIGCPLYLSFKDDKLFVALANGYSFEAGGGDTTLSEQRERVTGDIKAILDLVDTLYLKDKSIL